MNEQERARYEREPWVFTCPDGLSATGHTQAELERAWYRMRERIAEQREIIDGLRVMLDAASGAGL